MNSIADGSVIIQTSSQSVHSTPSWFGEATLIVEHLRKQGVLSAISERVRFARRRFGRYEVIDFFAVLFGYAISGEHTLEGFYEGLQPFASAFMALFDRDQLPARSTLSRFLAALTEAPIEALRTTSKREIWWIEQEMPGWSLTLMARVKPPANGPYLRQKHCPPLFAGWMRSVLLATQGVSGDRSCVRARSSVRPTVFSGSARLATAATDAIERNCEKASRPLVDILRAISFHGPTPCSGSTANMGPEPCSLI
jgi:hypothetical protein